MSGATQRGSPRYAPLLVAILLVWGTGRAMAENVDPSSVGWQYAWGENIGWLNAEPQGNGGPGMQVSDTAVSGWMWAENAGWISLSCENTASCGTNNYGVVNDGRGNLSGNAWSESLGWIRFRTNSGSDCCVSDLTPGCTDSACEAAICRMDPICCNTYWDTLCAGEAAENEACAPQCAASPFGVRINGPSGQFSGFAWAENAGWINFGSPTGTDNQIVTAWHCPDPDGDGVCSASDNCPTRSNHNQQPVQFEQTLRAANRVDFTWPTPTDYEMTTGTFSASASVGTWAVAFRDVGAGAVVHDVRMPPLGSGYWYLLRPTCGVGSYSTGSPREKAGRDAALLP